MTELRFALITQMRARGMTWQEIATEFHSKSGKQFGRTYINERERRANERYVRLLQRAAAQ